MDSIVPDSIIVPLQWINNVMDLLGNLQLAQLDDVPQGVVALDGHDAGQDRAVDADGAAVVDKFLEGGSFEEQLRDYEVSACIHFLPGLNMVLKASRESLTIPEVKKVIFVALSFRMSSWVT